MTTPLVIVGCGGFGREVHDVVDAINDAGPEWELLGYLDDHPEPSNRVLIQQRGFTVLGGVDWLDRASRHIHYVIGIGSGAVRKVIDARLASVGRSSATLIHPSATCGYGVSVGEGTVLCAGVRLTNNIRLGRHVHINLNSTIGHDALVDDYVTVNPLVAVSGNVHIWPEAMLGTNSAVLQGLSIGRSAVVGGGALVARDVPDDTVVKGVPAR